MTNTHLNNAQRPQDQFGRQIALRLSAGTSELSHEISERLRAARVRALSQRQLGARTASSVVASGGAAAMTFGDEGLSLWRRIASALPLIALAAGLIAINVIQNEHRASELAEVDAALLTDDLPPAAYADPGFLQFLKSGEE